MPTEYEGHVYIRPLGRGVFLGEPASPILSFEEWIGAIVDPTGAVGWFRDWHGRLRITVEVLEATDAD